MYSVKVDIDRANLARLAEAAAKYGANVSTAVSGRTIIAAPSLHIQNHGGRPRLIKKIKQRFSVMTLLEVVVYSGMRVKKQSLAIDGEDIQVLVGSKEWKDIAFTIRPDGSIETTSAVRDDLGWAITKELTGKGVLPK